MSTTELLVLSLVCSFLFGISFVLIHLLRKDLKFSQVALSEYALGKYDWVLTIGLYAVGVAQVTLALALVQQPGPASIGHLLLIAGGAGAWAVAAFETETLKRTSREYLHELGALIQFACFPAALWFMRGTFDNTLLNNLTTFVAITSSILLFVIVYKQAHKLTNRPSEDFGLVQKTNIILMYAWLVAIPLYFLQIL